MTKTRTLTLAGTEVARIGLGTNRLTNTAENRAFVNEAVAAGIGLIDSAHLYAGGASEATIGAALAPFPDGTLVATKGGYEPGHGRPDVLRGEIEESFRRLQTDTISLYYLHRVDPQTPLEESLAVIADYHEAGRIQAVGVSAVTVEQVERAREVVPITAVQNHYNLAERQYEDVVDYCAEAGIVFVPYFPLRDLSAPALSEIAQRHGATRTQIALAWLLCRSPAVLPIPGTLSIEHLLQNLAALEIELDDGEFDALC